MKKLSIIIVLALCLTITGAYATWTFATDAVDESGATVSNVGIGMVIESEGSMGTLTASFADYAYRVVPNSNNEPTLANGNEDAKFIVTFVAEANAEDSVKTDGVTAFVDLSVSTAFTSGSYANVLTANDTHGITIAAGTWSSRTVDNETGKVTFTYEISSATIMSWMKVANTTALTNVNDATAYKAAVEAGRFEITVSTTN